MNVKRSLEVTHGATMIEPTLAVSTSLSDGEKPATAVDSDKPYPTEEEFATLPKVPGHIPWTSWTVAVVEFAERFSYYGTTAVCEYIITPYLKFR